MLNETLISLSIVLAQLQDELQNRKQPIESVEEKALNKLIKCESNFVETAVNYEDAKTNKLPSFGILQFSPYTLLNAAKRYNLVPLSFTLKEILAMRFNSSFQKEVARNLLADGEWRHWKTCSIKTGMNLIAFNY